MKKPRPLSRSGRLVLARQRPTLPHGNPCSTIGSEELDFRVRDGIGYGLFDIATGNFWASVFRQQRHACNCRFLVRRARYGFVESRSREIRPDSGHQLKLCLRRMVKPHGLLVLVSSTPCSASTPSLSPRSLRGAFSALRQGHLISRPASRLYAFSGYLFRTWLPGYADGSTTGTPEVRPPRSSRTMGSSSQVSCAHGR